MKLGLCVLLMCALIKHTFLRLVKITSFLERMLVSELKKART